MGIPLETAIRGHIEHVPTKTPTMLGSLNLTDAWETLTGEHTQDKLEPDPMSSGFERYPWETEEEYRERLKNDCIQGVSGTGAGAAGDLCGIPFLVTGGDIEEAVESGNPAKIGAEIGLVVITSSGRKGRKIADVAEAGLRSFMAGKRLGRHLKRPVTYGRNEMVKLKKHSQHMRETARAHGVDIPKKPSKASTQQAMRDWIERVVDEGETRQGRYMTVDDALWTRLGDGIVVQKPDGEFITYLDYSKGDVARGWDNIPSSAARGALSGGGNRWDSIVRELHGPGF